MDIEASNHRQIERLNQRGGRTLSIVDLMEAGTISPQMAAYALRAMAGGASLLTGAVPGGAGKTTLMAAILHFLPPRVPIVTTDRSAVIREALARPPEPACYLAHEIGSGHWYGYIWGEDVARFLSLIEGPRRIASCLHADTLEELAGILTAPPLGVSPEALGRVDLVLFMHVDRGLRGTRRRVSTFHVADGRGGHRLLYQWEPEGDTFRQAGDLADPQGLEPYAAFVRRLAEDGETDCRAVRRKVLAFYQRGE
ncbi:MAG: hypothetical protein ACLF0G_04045 [Candidatus Brocadiia bacterium]